jgi:wobble nucleotide-excising tRNase
VKLEKEKQLLDSTINSNCQLLRQKINEPSKSIKLQSLRQILNNIDGEVVTANIKIDENNDTFHNNKTEKIKLTNQIWKFLANESESEIDNYTTMKGQLKWQISLLEAKKRVKIVQQQLKTTKLATLEKESVSIQPTLEGINKILSSVGFSNFCLAKGNDGKTYKLVRDNGTEALNTLSEGETKFVTFLYFYYLLKGSHTESEIAKDKIIVFDDPVSSLDNEILFIVSSLIHKLVGEAKNQDGNIKQIFILTHNVYFHKEVTFHSGSNREKIFNYETFWLIKKVNSLSIIEKQSKNPIKTAYQLLWDEVRSTKRNNNTLQNTLRRILENYFKLLGNIPLADLYKNFEGHDIQKCKALCSWVHDGSHSAFDDDYYTALDDTNIERFLQVFREIFEKSGHIAHYNMMMGIEK